MRSVALAAGTIVLLEILMAGKRYWWRLLPWTIALGATLVTLETWGRGVLLTNSRADVRDALIPTLMGIMEFLMFAILAPRHTRTDEDFRIKGKVEPWHLWPFLNAVHALMAVFLVLNRIHNTDPINDFAPTLRPLASEYVGWMWNDVYGATAGFVIMTILGFLTIFFVQKDKTWSKYVYTAFAIIPLIVYTNVIIQANAQRVRTETVAFSLKPEGEDSKPK